MNRQAILVPLSPAELIDKITILQIKSQRIQDPAKLAHVESELQMLRAVHASHVESSGKLDTLTGQLREVNERLWQIEDDIRSCESTRDFGQRFIELARRVYLENDRRAELKRAINLLLSSELIEQKHFSSQQPASEKQRGDAR